MTTRYLLTPTTIAALALLEDPAQHVRLKLIKDRAPDIRDLHSCQFPPYEVHRDTIAPTFRFDLKLGVLTELAVMVRLIDEQDGPGLVFGFLSHTTRQRLIEEAEEHGLEIDDINVHAERSFIAVEFNFVHRDGHIRISNELYALLCALKAEDIERAVSRESRIGKRTRI